MGFGTVLQRTCIGITTALLLTKEDEQHITTKKYHRKGTNQIFLRLINVSQW
jgi:hypothetical protein